MGWVGGGVDPPPQPWPGCRQTALQPTENPRWSEMKNSGLNKSRFIVGLVLVGVAALMFLFGRGEYSTAGAIGIGMLGLISVAVSRRR